MQIEQVDEALAEVFGRYSEKWQPADPLRKLIERVLGQRTTGAHVRRAFENLQAHCSGGWADVTALPHDVLVDLIRPVGLAQPKAARVQGILERIYQDQGAYTLDFLREMDLRSATRYLLTLPGVGDHTAALVLMFGLGRPGVMPVDSHVHRVARRLGWAPHDASPKVVQQAIEAAAPAMNMMDLHVNLGNLGHRECRSGMPDCPNCPVNHLCGTALRQPWWAEPGP
ncbi:MAG: base excision repair protein HhH-GPD family [Symbiobacteriaceae bacterium]|jgi:endonuclease-3|nr:base excision repair protein HhH-GPD family [Symbiobacteriaceae bacterium]